MKRVLLFVAAVFASLLCSAQVQTINWSYKVTMTGDMEKVFVERNPDRKKQQKSFFFRKK